MNSPPLEIGNDAARLDMRWKRGDTWVFEYEDGLEVGTTFTPTDLTGVSMRLHVVDSSGVILLVRSSAAGTLAITPLEGKVAFKVLPSEWPTINWQRGVYDLEYTYLDGTVETVLEGNITIVQDRTR